MDLVDELGVVTFKADKSPSAYEGPAPPGVEADKLLKELGNAGMGIPFYAIYPADGSAPITFDGPLTQGKILAKLREAGPSKSKAPAVAAMPKP